MDKDERVIALRQQLQNTAGWENDTIARSRVDALNYYFQRKRGDEVTGRSQVVAGDISASVDANLAQMLDAFSSDNIIEFDPLGPEDEDQAQLESDAVVHFVMKSQNGFTQLAQAIKDALLLRNGIMKVWVDEFKQTRTRTFQNVSPEARSQLTFSQDPDIQLDELSYADSTLRVRATRVLKRFRAEAIAPENFLYPKNYDSFDLQEIPFVAERRIDSRSDLIRMGFPKAAVNRLTAYSVDAVKGDSFARNPSSIMTPFTPSPDPSQDMIEWFECYWLYDVDGDGIAERRRLAFVWNDDVVLEDEPVNIVPYAVGAVLINPHRMTGISIYDKLRQTQDEHTALKRALDDNVNTVTKNRLAYLDGKVNVDDVSDGRPNGAIRVRANSGITDVRQAVMPFGVPDNSSSILQNIEALKRERTEMGGAALDMQTNQTVVGGDRMGSQGLDRAFSVMEQLSAMMTKTLAATLIRNTFLLAHATLRENFDKPVQLKRNGKWQSAVPSEWQPRNRITVKVGMSPGERARKAATLGQIVQNQITLAEKGMDEVLVNLDGFYKALMDWGRISEVQNPEQYFVDPQSDNAQKALDMKTKQSAADAQMRQNLMTQAVELEQLKVMVEKYAADADRQFKYFEAVLKSEEVEAQIVGEATVDLLKTREQGQARANESTGRSKATAEEQSTSEAA